jgi:hypothetical protein
VSANQMALVRFPHPGREHQPGAADLMPWNRDAHARKFLLADGRWTSGDDMLIGPVTLWGEWEPDSEVVGRLDQPVVAGGPRYLHKPLLPSSNPEGFHQNTDPLVLDGFTYSNCRQHRNRKLRALVPGSLVLFGSMVASEFVLDTCFVVDDSPRPYTLLNPPMASAANASG